MSEGFNIDIVNPEKSFLSKENVSEVVVPAYEKKTIETLNTKTNKFISSLTSTLELHIRTT